MNNAESIETMEPEPPTLTQDQQIALDLAEAWWRDPARFEKPFRLDGFAGTGKTFLAEALVEKIGVKQERVLALAPTGKAARVLARRTGWPTSTIHRFLYTPLEDPRVITAREKLDQALSDFPEQVPAARAELAEAEKESKLSFASKGADLSNYDVIVVDESLMVSEPIAEDLLELKKPLLLLGDPGQLPPVKGRPGFEDITPKRTLTEIKRQDAGSSILEAAMRVREGGSLSWGTSDDGAFRVARPKELSDEEYLEHDIVLCGTHRTRRGFNRRIRRLMGYEDSAIPKSGEKLVVRKNDYKASLMNGQIVDVLADAEPISDMEAQVPIRDDLGRETEIRANILRLREHFERGVDVHYVRGTTEVDWAYCLTIHSFQGSETESVAVLDDWRGGQVEQLLYTALTRGSKKVTLVTDRW